MPKKFIIEAIIVALLIIGIAHASSTQINENITNDSLSEQQKQWLKNNPGSLPIWMTPEEKLRINEIGKEFQPTGPPPTPIRQPAEFEPMEGVLIRYPFGISYEIIAEMAEDVEVVTIVASESQKNSVLDQYQIHGVNLDHCSFLIAPTDSYWTRDYGPWFIITGNDEQGIVDFIYNRPRPNDDQIPMAYGNWQGIPVYGMNLVHSGGNYMTDGQGISVSTNLVWTENPGFTHEQIDQMVEDYLGIHTYHVVPDALGEYIKHIDCWAKYLAPDVIMIIEVSPSHSHYDEIEEAVDYFENQLSCYGTHYQIERVYTHLNEPYINSLILNDKVLVPITGSSWDDGAIASYEAAMPGYEVLGFTGSWQSTDALHCRTMGITDRYMLYIEHTPLIGNQTTQDGYEIQAKIKPYSGENIKSDSTGVNWKIEGGEWNFIQMDPLGDDNYQAIIPAQEDETTVYYYIHAEDDSGRSENHPYIGAPDPHVFTAIVVNDPPEIPIIDGPTRGKAGTSYEYTFTSTDPEGDNVSYYIRWGDGDVVPWTAFQPSGSTYIDSHIWIEEGNYIIRAKAKDIHGEESDWGTLSVRMPRNKASINSPLFLRFFPRVYILNNRFS